VAVGLVTGGFVAGADPVEDLGQVGGGELPVERPGGLVVPVGGGQEGGWQLAGAGEVVGRDDLFLHYEKKFYLVLL
jgi:hypothetical protein